MLNYKRSKALWNLFDTYSKLIKRSIENNYEKIILELENIDKNSESKTIRAFIYFHDLFFLYNKNLIFDLNTFPKINSIKKLAAKKIPTIISEFLYDILIDSYNEKCKYWENENLISLRLLNLKQEISEIENFLTNNNDNKEEFIKNFINSIISNLIENYLLPEFDNQEILNEIPENINIPELIINLKKQIEIIKQNARRTIDNDLKIHIREYHIANLESISIEQSIEVEQNMLLVSKDILKNQSDNMISKINDKDIKISITKINRGKKIDSWSFYYLYLPVVKSFTNYLEYLKLELNNSLTENRPAKKITKNKIAPVISFKIFAEKTQIVKNIIRQLVYKVYFIDEDITSIDNLISALISSDLSKIKYKIQLNCETIVAAYIFHRLKPYFKNLKPTIIEKSNLFYSKQGVLIRANNLYTSKQEYPKEKREIDKIFNLQ